VVCIVSKRMLKKRKRKRNHAWLSYLTQPIISCTRSPNTEAPPRRVTYSMAQQQHDNRV